MVKTFTGVVYKPPLGNKLHIYTFIEPLDNIRGSNVFSFVIMRDANIYSSRNSSQEDDFRDIVAPYECSNQKVVPTTIAAKSPSSLDIGISNLTDTDVMAGAFSCSISDQLHILFSEFHMGQKGRDKEMQFQLHESGRGLITLFFELN